MTSSQTILITVDALRADHLGQYGYDRDTMPALTRLVDDGIVYEQAFANGGHTRLSIPSFLTSRLDGIAALKRGLTVASQLQEAGVTTAGFHANPVISNNFPSVAGFDDWFDCTDVSTDTEEASGFWELLREAITDTTNTVLERLRPHLGQYDWVVRFRRLVIPDTVVHETTPYTDAMYITERVVEWVEAHADKEFFLWVHYMDPHRPYGFSQSDPPFAEGSLSEAKVNQLMAKAGVSPDAVTDVEREKMVDLYDSDLRYLSGHLEKFFEKLQENGLWDDATVLFSADHGEEFGEHGLYYHRNKPYDELIHVPLIEKPAGGRAATDSERVHTQRELLDLAPTVLKQHDVTRPTSFEGQPLDEGGATGVVAAAFRNDRLMLGVRRAGYKYLTTEDGEDELYDLEADPGEQTSILTENSETVDRLQMMIPEEAFGLRASVKDLNEQVEVTNTAEERLAALGYLE